MFNYDDMSIFNNCGKRKLINLLSRILGEITIGTSYTTISAVCSFHGMSTFSVRVSVIVLVIRLQSNLCVCTNSTSNNPE